MANETHSTLTPPPLPGDAPPPPLPAEAEEMTPRAAQAEVRRREQAHPVIRLLKPISSLKLTVALFAMAMVIVLCGTLAQIDKGIQTVMKEYFRTGLAWIDLGIFLPRSYDFHFEVPFPGGYTIGGLMLLNLLAAHTVRFTVKTRGSRLFNGLIVLAIGAALVACLIGEVHHAIPLLHDFYWELLLVIMVTSVLMWGCILVFDKRAGIVLLHGGLIFMLASEGVTGWFQVETNMSIHEGQASNFVESTSLNELAFVDTSDTENHNEAVVSDKALARGGEIKDPALPFDLVVTGYMRNSAREIAKPDDPLGPIITVKTPQGVIQGYLKIIEKPEGTGVSADQRIDMGAVDVTFKDKKTGTEVGKYRLSLWHGIYDQPMLMTADGRPWAIELRHTRTYKPYTITLIDFKHDRYLGTNTPKNFSSRIRLIDPVHSVDRESLVWMNHPLRYSGETFFQSAFLPGDAGTVLLVVANPGRIIPYLSCVMVAMGLIVHFGSHLSRFIERSAA